MPCLKGNLSKLLIIIVLLSRIEQTEGLYAKVVNEAIGRGKGMGRESTSYGCLFVYLFPYTFKNI